MNEHNISQNKQAEPGDMEQRLSAYYGPPLPEQSLPPASWHAVHHRLGVHASARCRRGFRLRLPRKRLRAFVPTAMQDAFARIASEAGIPSTQARLRYRLAPRSHQPVVRGSGLARRNIPATPPLDAATKMERDELDVPLATGVARFPRSRKLAPRLTPLLVLRLM